MDRYAQRTVRTMSRMRAFPVSGATLVAVLLTVVISLAACGWAVQVYRGVGGEIRDLERERHMQNILQIGEEFALDWLWQHANEAVAPLDGGGFLVVSDSWVQPFPGGVEVVLFDHCAGIPSAVAHPGHPLWPLLAPFLAGAPLGEDSLNDVDLLEKLAPHVRIPPFPDFPARIGRVWEAEGGSLLARSAGAKTRVSLATMIGRFTNGRINVNTAPRPVLEAACELLGTDAKPIIENRRRGVPSYPNVAGQGVFLAGQSNAWGALIVVESRGIRRIWWVDIIGEHPAYRVHLRHNVNSN